jgi:hypothetical protein
MNYEPKRPSYGVHYRLNQKSMMQGKQMIVHYSLFIVHVYDYQHISTSKNQHINLGAPASPSLRYAARYSLGPRCGLALRATASHRWRGAALSAADTVPETSLHRAHFKSLYNRTN